MSSAYFFYFFGIGANKRKIIKMVDVSGALDASEALDVSVSCKHFSECSVNKRKIGMNLEQLTATI